MAAELANEDPKDPDPELDMPLEQLKSAVWGSHSCRRMSDKMARDWADKVGADRAKERIDSQKGWNQAEMEKDMQYHYDANTLRRRVRDAEMTFDF